MTLDYITKNIKLILLAVLVALASISVSAKSNKIESNWQTLNKRGYPEWFGNAKLGIFIHWGLYSVPSWAQKDGHTERVYKDWQGGNLQAIDFAKEIYGENFTYGDFRSHFKGEMFEAAEWAKLFKDSGAKYVILSSKHQDGYALWPSSYAPNWNSVETGPKRDIVGELSKAINNEGLKMGVHYSLTEWSNPLHKWAENSNDSLYLGKHMIPQLKELIAAYKPELLYTDGEWWNTADQWEAEELIAWYYNLVGRDAIVNNKWGHGTEHGFVSLNSSSDNISNDRPWTEVRGLGYSLGLNRNEPLSNYLTEESLIHHFASLVAYGGGLTINIAPAADGQIPLIQQERLQQLGKWLEINGEAIYNSKPYVKRTEERATSINNIDPRIHLSWERIFPESRIKFSKFSVEWNGFLAPNYTEAYQLHVKANDKIKIWIDGKVVIDQINGNKTSKTIDLVKGNRYPIRIEYIKDTQDASLSLRWSSPSQMEGVIPSSAFFVDNSLESKNGLSGKYNSTKDFVAYTTKGNVLYAILLEWQDDECVLDIAKPADNAKISLLGREGNLPWKYENGKVKVDMTSIKYSEMPSKVAWTLKISN